MLSMYPACFFKEESGYSVIFPDLDLATCGKTIDEAMAMAVDCLAGRLRWLKKDGEAYAKEHFDKSVRKTLLFQPGLILQLWRWTSIFRRCYRKHCLQKCRHDSAAMVKKT